MKRKMLVILILVAFLSMGMTCSNNLQDSWNKLTPDQKARIILNDIQSQLNTKFDEGKAIVTLKPQYQEIWKTKIVPAFDTANKSVKSAILLAKAGKMTPEQVYSQVNPALNNVITLLAQIGIK